MKTERIVAMVSSAAAYDAEDVDHVIEGSRRRLDTHHEMPVRGAT